jgi:hypothetical protein
MSQESINHCLSDARLSDGTIDWAYLQDIEKFPEYADFFLDEKQALVRIDRNSIITFLNSAKARRTNASDANRIR